MQVPAGVGFEAAMFANSWHRPDVDGQEKGSGQRLAFG